MKQKNRHSLISLFQSSSLQQKRLKFLTLNSVKNWEWVWVQQLVWEQWQVLEYRRWQVQYPKTKSILKVFLQLQHLQPGLHERKIVSVPPYF